MTSVLYDVPGPKVILRNRILGVVTVLVVGAVIGMFVYLLAQNGEFSAEKWYVFTFTRVWQKIGEALVATLLAFAAAAAGALVLSFILAIGRMSDHAWVRIPFAIIVEVLRAVPVLVYMFLFYYALQMDKFLSVVVALILYNGSVLAEVIRAGVESLPRGQKEAGYAVGLRKSGVMRMILMPQALRLMLPVIIAQLVVTLKDTALGYIITYEELLFYARSLGSQVPYDSPMVQSTIVIGAIYIVLCLLLSWLAHIVEKRSRSKMAALKEDAAGTGGNEALQHAGTETELIVTQQATRRSK